MTKFFNVMTANTNLPKKMGYRYTDQRSMKQFFLTLMIHQCEVFSLLDFPKDSPIPNECELCDVVLGSEKERKNHLKIHT